MQWDWLTFYIQCGILLSFGWILDAALCWYFQYGVSVAVSIAGAILAVLVAAMNAASLVAKQRNLTD